MDRHKKTLRTQLRAQRLALSKPDAANLSQRIAYRALGAIDWTSIASLHIYQPIHQQREVDTTPLLQTIWQQYPQVRTATWQKTPDSYEAWWVDTAGRRGPVLPEHQFSAIVVPLLGFNDAGHRIGFGGGFYDRFLATQPAAVTIGLCYEFGYTAAFHPETHDVPLRHIITESQVKSFAAPH